MTDQRKAVLVTLPSQMKRKIVAISNRGGNMNDTVVGILAAKFGVDFEPTRRHGVAGCESLRIVLRMPPLLKRRIQIEALDKETDMNQVILMTLAAKLRMRTPPRRSHRSTPFGGGHGRPSRRAAN